MALQINHTFRPSPPSQSPSAGSSVTSLAKQSLKLTKKTVVKVGLRNNVKVRSSSLEGGGSSSVTTAVIGVVTEVDKDTFWPIVEDAGDKTVILDMYTQWCGPCKIMAPKFQELAEKYDDVVFLKLDCNQENKVYHNNNMMINGRDYSASAVATAPRVSIRGSPDELYTLVLIDPDAPNPNEPSLKEVVSWIVTNIPGGSLTGRGTEFLEYNAPAPDIGVHRNIFVLYKQEGTLDGIETPASRTCFNARAFASKHNLSPVGLAYYNVRKEARKRKNLG